MLNGFGQPFVQFPSYSVKICVDGQVSAGRGDHPLSRCQGLFGKRERQRNGDREVASQVDGDSNLLYAGQRDASGKSARSAFESAY